MHLKQNPIAINLFAPVGSAQFDEATGDSFVDILNGYFGTVLKFPETINL
jgi:hypothetical protein